MTQATRFEDYATNEDAYIAEAAATLVAVKEAYERGDLSKSEYDELVEDTLEMDHIDRLSDSLERKVRIKQAYQALLILAKAVM